jgi:hypothetical protein
MTQEPADAQARARHTATRLSPSRSESLTLETAPCPSERASLLLARAGEAEEMSAEMEEMLGGGGSDEWAIDDYEWEPRALQISRTGECSQWCLLCAAGRPYAAASLRAP